MRLLVEHRAANLADLSDAEALHEPERLARVRDVVRDEHSRRLEIDEIRNGRKDHRHVEPLVDAGVELDVHRPRVLDVERVSERSSHEEPASRDGEDQVWLVAVIRDLACEHPRGVSELRPREPFAFLASRCIVHRPILTGYVAAADFQMGPDSRTVPSWSAVIGTSSSGCAARCSRNQATARAIPSSSGTCGS